jgi:hypothetical protein
METEICPQTENLTRNIGDDNINNIICIQQMTIDRPTLETTMQLCGDFVESFADKFKHSASLLFYSITAVMFL